MHADESRSSHPALPLSGTHTYPPGACSILYVSAGLMMQRIYGLFVHQLEAGDVIGESTVMPGAPPGKHTCSILCGSYASAIVIDQAQFRAAMDQLSGQVCPATVYTDAVCVCTCRVRNYKDVDNL
jgi:hypothetical protein